jgi:DNA-binding CsgD family transcriptional regulator/PAS domain-containing protein
LVWAAGTSGWKPKEIAMARNSEKKSAARRSRQSVMRRNGKPASATEQEFIDRIYECAFVPELWPAVLDQLATLASARGGFLFVANKEVVNWTATESLRMGMQVFVSGNFYTRGERARRGIAARYAGFLREQDIYTERELQNDPMYRDMLWPVGLGHAAGIVIPAPTGDVLFLSVERRRSLGPVEDAVIKQLDILRPHLARSALMSARLQLERARIAGEVLASVGLPALVLDERGQVLAANPLIEALTGHIRWRAQDRVSLKDAGADALFRQAIETLPIAGAAPTRSFAVRGAETAAAMVAHVIPIRRSSRDIFERSAAVLLLTPVTLPNEPPVELVTSLFDFTPAEARVARSLTSGKTLDDIASSGGVSRHTVRTQLRAVLQKTGCARQAEVVALLSGLNRVTPAP